MQTVVGYYDWQSGEQSVSDKDFFVHCSGRYKLLHKESFKTERPGGANNYQLLYIANGKARFRIQGEMHLLEKGHCVLYRPLEDQYYYYFLEETPDIYWVHFSCKEGNEFFEKSGFGKENIFYVGTHNSYVQLFDTMIWELQMQQPFFEEQLQLQMQELLLKMGRNRLRETTIFENYNKEVEEAIRLFHSAPERDFTIKEYTKERGLNYYRFIDNFTHYTGTSPRQYIINIRMTIAKDLLVNSLFQIAEIALLTGYENPLYFSRLFKKTWGLSPTEFRKQAKVSNFVV
ncbi:helix-turn-helix domain-containing protein [Konateibacter massiliensis]|uniref:helix-turn-helix domain-containing protein n=1 Tax=Konateibacter massiliensis TaxID=2002841 RepID=UPI000C15C207|nr:AraC family transcriptional regulator [Konateibacter massiliensis]